MKELAPPGRDPRAEYERRLAERAETAAAAERKQRRISSMRLAVFISGVLLAWLSTRTASVSGFWVLVPLVGFGLLMALHARVLEARDRARSACAHYRRGLARLDYRVEGQRNDGTRYLDPEHLYAGDLDLFGPGSLFELIGTAPTRAGQDTLAAWLKVPAQPEEILRRQEAVDELRERVGLREDLALLGDAVRAEVDPRGLARWAKEPGRLRGGFWPLAAAGMSAVTLATLTGWFFGAWPAGFVLLALLIQGVFALGPRGVVKGAVEGADGPAAGLSVLAGVLRRLEEESFGSRLLVELSRALETDGVPPSTQIARLGRLVELLDWRRNQMFAPIGMVLLWGTHLGLAVEGWRSRVGPQVPVWMAALGRMEALCALAGQAYEHPDDPFPEILTQGPPRLQARGLGHPLLPEERCVRNDLDLGQPHTILVVSGSNMSGKTTMLRTLGVNAVLAQAGGTVRARSLRLTPLTVGASIRILDSLQEGRSRFYAEITRIRQIVQRAGGTPQLLFLIDEILHGTNSHDRAIGAEGVIRALLDRGALGCVTTHDLALARVADSLAPGTANIHFQDDLVDGKMAFDYRIHPGVVTRSNALALMRAVGLQVGSAEPSTPESA